MATSTTGLPLRAIMFLLKLLVPVLALFLLLNMFWKPHVGRFSCSITPWFASAAYADGGCPDSIRAAMNNTGWAEDRWAEIKDAPRTTGLWFDENGQRHKIRSGDEKGDDAKRAGRVLREVGAPSARNGTYPAATHVEVKVAALMRESGEKIGVVVINHEAGPCPGAEGLGCQDVLPLVLAPGSTLRVWWMDEEKGVMLYRDFTGR